MLHGFSGGKCEARFIFVALSRRLAAEGIASLRFDFRGSGESEGEFEEMTPLEELSDARAALRHLSAIRRIDRRRMAVVGFSLGGMIAAMTAAREPSLKAAVLWSPVAHPSEIMTRNRPASDIETVNREGRIDMGGLFVGRAFVETMSELDPLVEIAKSRVPLLLVHGTEDDGVPFSHSADYLAAAEAAGVPAEIVPVDGADHVFSAVALREKVLDATTGFLKRHLL
jgi:dipeptidyl aminopeptidase/acylaminoacyl peptidase